MRYCRNPKKETGLSYLPHSFIAADVADFQTEGFEVADDGTAPEGFGLVAVLRDIAELIDFDLAVGVPFARGGCTVQAQVLDQFQPLVADFDVLVALFADI